MPIYNKLPRLKRTLINPRDTHSNDDNAERLMMAGIARDEYAALDLMNRHKELPVPELVKLLRKPRRANWKRRLMAILRRWEGSYEHDPHAAEFRAWRRGEQRGNHWM